MWSAPFGCYASVLGLRCAFTRKALLTQYQNEHPAKDGAAPEGKKALDEKLAVNVRAHVCFSEHVPIAMILMCVFLQSLVSLRNTALTLPHTTAHWPK